MRDVLTPDQAAEYLQIDRAAVYRYIREGKLEASRLGRAYRIPRQSIDLLLRATRTKPYIKLRQYTDEQLDQFAAEDLLDEQALDVVRRFTRMMDEAEAQAGPDQSSKQQG